MKVFTTLVLLIMIRVGYTAETGSTISAIFLLEILINLLILGIRRQIYVERNLGILGKVPIFFKMNHIYSQKFGRQKFERGFRPNFLQTKLME